MSHFEFEPAVTRVSVFSNVVYPKTSSFEAIGPYTRLFERVKLEYTNDSKIAKAGAFQKYMLGKYYNFVHMARETIYNNRMLRDCKIIPMRTDNEYMGQTQPFWFKIEHTRFDKAKNTEKEICDNFWKSFGGFGIKLVSLGMSFEDIRNNINRIIQNETHFAVKVRVTTADVILSCQDILGVRRSGWYGRKNWEYVLGKTFKRTKNTSFYSRPKLTDEEYKKFVHKKFKKKVVETVWYETKPNSKNKSGIIGGSRSVRSGSQKPEEKSVMFSGKYNEAPIVKKKFTVGSFVISSNGRSQNKK